MTQPEPPQPPLMGHLDAQGAIDALTRRELTAEEAVAGGWRPVSPTDADVEAFLRSENPSQADTLSQTDTAMARVLEDLIDTLIARGLIQFTDLPQAAQAKLLSRRQTRAALKDPLQLLPFADNPLGWTPGNDVA